MFSRIWSICFFIYGLFCTLWNFHTLYKVPYVIVRLGWATGILCLLCGVVGGSCGVWCMLIAKRQWTREQANKDSFQ